MADSNIADHNYDRLSASVHGTYDRHNNALLESSLIVYL